MWILRDEIAWKTLEESEVIVSLPRRIRGQKLTYIITERCDETRRDSLNKQDVTIRQHSKRAVKERQTVVGDRKENAKCWLTIGKRVLLVGPFNTEPLQLLTITS